MRKRYNISRFELSLMTDLPELYIKKLELGEIQKPPISVLKTLSNHLPCSYENLLLQAGYTKQVNLVKKTKEEEIDLGEYEQDIIKMLKNEFYLETIKTLSSLDEKRLKKAFTVIRVLVEY